MADSILDSVKKSLGVGSDYDVFDPDIIMHINTAFSTLTQLGIGPLAGFMIEDDEPTWDAFLGDDSRWNFIKTYVYLKVRMAFDPPATPIHVTAIDNQLHELEFRMSILREEILISRVVTLIPASSPEVEIDGGGADLA